MDAPTLPSPTASTDDKPMAGNEWSDPALRTLLPEHLGHRYQAVPLRRENGELIVGMVTPGDLRAVDDLRALLGERRVIEMGIEPFLVTSAVDCVLARRLARRSCERCKVSFEPTELELHAAKWDFSRASTEGLVLYRAVGCPQCGGTGYRGRLAIHEVILMSEELDKLVVARASSEDLRRVAMDQGMMDLRSDGLAKVALGTTTLQEVARVVA
jgi:Type II secretion system (T2SS), protein E, N-terminal domain